MWLTAAISKRKVLSSHWSFPNFSLPSCPNLFSCRFITLTCKTIWTFVLWFSPLRVSALQLFVGLSFPYEGPAPLEAIANGCAFLNPKFNPPKSSKNTDFFKGKPTLREVSGGDHHHYSGFFRPWKHTLCTKPALSCSSSSNNASSLCSWPLSILTPRCTSVNHTCGRWTLRTLPRWRRPFALFSAKRLVIQFVIQLRRMTIKCIWLENA